MKSSASSGPRIPAFSELWLSGTTTPDAVVSAPWSGCTCASSCFCLARATSLAFARRRLSCLDWGMKAASARVEVERDEQHAGNRGERKGADPAGAEPHEPFRPRSDQVHDCS